MLKIKDNVDLKELEKYGFDNSMLVRYKEKYKFASKCGTNTYKIWVNNDKHLSIVNATNKVFDVLYDLIKDGLVEKEEDR